MANFSHLSSLAVGGKTAEMVLYRLEGQPVLRMVSAMQDNKGYVNGALKKSTRLARRARQGDMTAEMLAEDRRINRELFARHVIVGWQNILDINGKEVSFNTEVCLEFLTALPDYIFDDIREFANNPSNFIDYDSDDTNIDQHDLELTVKN